MGMFPMREAGHASATCIQRDAHTTFKAIPEEIAAPQAPAHASTHLNADAELRNTPGARARTSGMETE
ncbi:hypothetical protein EVAR_29373_1 [Eumeta japonica]|uniref:Uncharacterized protein n=1 Tax=Eumeta variegata TaxID=151549 RepID=A0A4C1YAZ1_EUMVA|nr:hypothetical protein EVAR_29373_1 [Eumeta japonica]